MHAEPISEPDEILRYVVLEQFADSSLINIKHLHVGVSAEVVHLAEDYSRNWSIGKGLIMRKDYILSNGSLAEE